MSDGEERGSLCLLLSVAYAAMRTGWLYPWALLAGRWVHPDDGTPLLSGLAVFLLLLAGDLTARWTLRRRWPLARARAMLVAMGLLAVALVVRVDHYGHYAPLDPGWLGSLGRALATTLPSPQAPALAATFGVYLWWRGLKGAQSKIDMETVERAFAIGLLGIVSFVAAALAALPARWDHLQAGSGAYVVGFLFAGLVALSLARQAGIRERSRAGGEGSRLNHQWLALVIGVAATLLLGALALANALSFDLIAAVAGPLLGPLGALAWLLFEAVALLVGLLLVPLFYLLRWLPRPDEPFALQSPDMSVIDRLQREGTRAVLPPEIEMAAKGVAIVTIAALTVLVLARAIAKRRLWADENKVDEEHEWVWDWRSAAIAFLAWMHALRPHRRARPGPAPPAAALDADRAPAVTVRQVYWQLLRLGSRVGLARPVGATPYEHLPHLCGRLGPADDVTAITHAYVRARYGEQAPTDAETAEMQQRWQRVRMQTDASAGPADTAVTGGCTTTGQVDGPKTGQVASAERHGEVAT